MLLTLHTERLVLRPPKAADGAALSAAINDVRVLSQTGTWGFPSGQDVCAARLAQAARYDPREDMVLLVTADGIVLGTVGLHRRGAGVFELGYMLGPGAWGRGYATEAARAACAYGFGPLGAARLTATVFADNPASMRVLEKLGFDGPHPAPDGWSPVREASLPTVAYVLDKESRP